MSTHMNASPGRPAGLWPRAGYSGIKAFGEHAVDLRQELLGCLALALALPQPAQPMMPDDGQDTGSTSAYKRKTFDID
jgi:hypothetical protein